MYEFLGLKTEQWEIVYYIAFILLTLGIAFFTVKTYLFQSKKVSKLYCKCIESKTVNYHSDVYLEVYNYGNIIAKNVKVTIQNKDMGTIPFLKPNEAYLIPFGFFIQTLSGKLFQSHSIKINENNCVSAELDINGKTDIHHLDLTMLLNTRSISEIDTKFMDKISDEMKSIIRAQESTAIEIRKVADEIRRKR